MPRDLGFDWRRQATRLDRQAAELRRDGDPLHAEELEQAAIEYRAAATELELGLWPSTGPACTREPLYNVVGRSGNLATGIPLSSALDLAVVSGAELCSQDDHSASRRVDVLERDAPHLLAPSSPLEGRDTDA